MTEKPEKTAMQILDAARAKYAKAATILQEYERQDELNRLADAFNIERDKWRRK